MPLVPLALRFLGDQVPSLGSHNAIGPARALAKVVTFPTTLVGHHSRARARSVRANQAHPCRECRGVSGRSFATPPAHVADGAQGRSRGASGAATSLGRLLAARPRMLTLAMSSLAAPPLLAAAGWSLMYLLFGGGFVGAVIIFIVLKVLGR